MVLKTINLDSLQEGINSVQRVLGVFQDFSNNPKYVHCNKYFHDGVHLNAHGADEFTKDLVKKLREQKIID